MREVRAGLLWVGNALDGCDFTRLFEYGICAVMQLAYEEPPISPPRELVYMRFPLLDCGGNDLKLVRAAFHSLAQLLRAETPTLVCCGLGMNRSPAIAAAAMSLVYGIHPSESLGLVAKSGALDISPQLWDEICSAMKL